MKTKILFCLIIFLNTFCVIAQNQEITWSTELVCNSTMTRLIKPEHYKLYPRNANNKGTVKFAGITNGFTAITIRVIKVTNNSEIILSNTVIPIISNNFQYSCEINSELCEYKFTYTLNGQNTPTIIAEHVVCGDVYIINGQSNALTYISDVNEISAFEIAYGQNSQYGKYSRTYGRIYDCQLEQWGYSSIATNDYFVGAWGLYIQNKMSEINQVPTCIINGAVGNTTISEHIPVNPFDNVSIFGILTRKIYAAGVENDIKGLIWYQGESDIIASNLNYKNDFKTLYDAWHQYYNPKKIYILQVHSRPVELPNTTPIPSTIRAISEFQRQFAANYPDIELMSTNGVQNTDGIHFHSEGYRLIGERILKLLQRDWYCSTNITDITPPNIVRAYYTFSKPMSTLTLEFNQNINTIFSDQPADVSGLIYLNSGTTMSNPVITGNKFSVKVSNLTSTTVSYLGTLHIWNWADLGYLRNSNGIAALSFDNVPISNSASSPVNPYLQTYSSNYWLKFNLDNLTKNHASGEMALNSNYNQLYYRYNNRILCVYNANQWVGGNDLAYTTPVTDATGDVVFDQVSGKVFYQAGNTIKCIYYNSSTGLWQKSNLNFAVNDANLAGGSLVVGPSGNQIYYRTSLNSIGRLYICNSSPETWCAAPLIPLLNNVAGCIAVNNNVNQIYYKTTDNSVGCVYYWGGWQLDEKLVSSIDDVSGNIVVNTITGDIFYKATVLSKSTGITNTINRIYWDGIWKVSTINSTLNDVYGYLAIQTSTNRIFYKSIFNDIKYMWNDGFTWKSESLNSASGSNVDGYLTVNELTGSVYYKTTNPDNSINMVYWGNPCMSMSSGLIKSHIAENNVQEDTETSPKSEISRNLFFKLYPNPANSELNIEVGAEDDNYPLTLQLYNVIGKLEKTFSLNSEFEKLNISDMSNGVYFISIYNNDRSVIDKMKFVIQH